MSENVGQAKDCLSAHLVELWCLVYDVGCRKAEPRVRWNAPGSLTDYVAVKKTCVAGKMSPIVAQVDGQRGYDVNAGILMAPTKWKDGSRDAPTFGEGHGALVALDSAGGRHSARLAACGKAPNVGSRAEM
jgi:hypothetical protein